MTRKFKQYTNPFLKVKEPLAVIADPANATIQVAIAFHQQGKLDQAEEICRQLLEVEPRSADVLHLLGVIAHQTGHNQRAVEMFDLAIEIDQYGLGNHYNKGVALQELKQFERSVASYSTAISLNPEFAEAYSNRGIALQELKQFDSAVASYDKAISLKPDYVEAYSNRGIALQELKQFDAAVASYDKAISLNPEFGEAYYNRGNALQELKQFDFAVANYDEAIALKPGYVEAYSNRGISLQELSQCEAAVASYDKAIALNPDYAKAHSNRGISMHALKQFHLAVASYDKAIALRPDYAEAYYNRGNALQELKQFDAAVASYDKAFDLNPSLDTLLSVRQYSKFFICDWGDLAKNLLVCESEIALNKTTVAPFAALIFFDKPELHLKSSKIFMESKYPKNKALGEVSRRTDGGKVRIGYYSADLHYHPVAIWLAEQLDNHDKSKFELFAFSYRSDIQDPMRARLEASFDHFIEVDKMSDLQVAQLSRELGIDIALDLMGFTGDCRAGIFASRAAPIQVSHLGFPGSMGAEYIDYVIGHTPSPDEDLEELARNRQFMTEKIAYVPSTFTYDRQRQLSDEPLTRSQFGLPETGFVFTCQNGCQKLMPEVFGVWMEILKAVPGSVLWLLKPNETAVKNLIKEANARGVEAERLIFTAREVVSIDQERARIGRYLASYNLADLFLDTWPYNAGTTAIDALWAGLPVLTKEGKAGVARMAAGALRGIEVPELITRTPQAYQELAIELAHNPEKLKQIKGKVQANRLTSALFDPVGNTRHIEAAYTMMYERYQAGLAPEHLYVASVDPGDKKSLISV